MTRRERYQADGFFLQKEPLFSSEKIARAVAGMDAIRRGEYDRGRPPQPSVWNPGDPESKLCKIEQPQFASHGIWDLLTDPALGKLAGELTDADFVQIWWVQLLYKPATSPEDTPQTNVGWHQDRYYWGVWDEGSELFTAWIALSDVHGDAGPMRFVRGSNHWGYLPESDFFAQDLETQKEALNLPADTTWEEVAAILPPGGVSFHDRLTLHASGPNFSGSPRRSFAVHLRTHRSRPVDDKRHGLTTFIDDESLCPVIFRR